MKAQELRIGNYIYGQYSFDDESKKELCEVLALDSTGELMEHEIWVGGESGKREFYYEFEPIPLTEEWLIDFGFRKDEETSYRWFMEDWLTYDLDDNCIRISDSWVFGKRKYVHELQNLFFALTGRELERKNNPGFKNN